MGRAPCCDKANVKRGPWSPEEDAKLKEYIEKHGTGGNWIALPQKAGLRRCGKSCRLRWLNYLRPNIKHGEFSDDEDRIICTLFANIGSRWSIIAAQLPGRTDNDIKNYWNTKLKKKILMGSSSLMLPNPYNSSQYHKIRPPNYKSYMNNIYPSSSSSSISFLQSPSSSLAFKCTSNHTTNSYNYSTLATPARSTFTAGNYETLSNNIISSSNLLLNLQTQDGFVGPVQSLYQEKGLSPLIMFGGAAAAAAAAGGSCSNSSDGSNKDQVEYHEQFMLFSNGGGNIIDGTNNIIPQEKQIHGAFNGGDQIPLDYINSTLEEIKQLISTNHVSYVNSNLSFFVDENKTTTEEEEKKAMMYY